MWPTDSPPCRTGAPRKDITGFTGTGGRSSGRPRLRRWPCKSRTRTDSRSPRRASKSFIPPGMSQTLRTCSGSMPEARKAWGSPASSSRVIAPYRASVSARALSRTPCSTVSTSRLSLMRRLASLNRDRRSRNAWFSRARFSACMSPSEEGGRSPLGSPPTVGNRLRSRQSVNITRNGAAGKGEIHQEVTTTALKITIRSPWVRFIYIADRAGNANRGFERINGPLSTPTPPTLEERSPGASRRVAWQTERGPMALAVGIATERA